MAIVTYYIVNSSNNICSSIIDWDDTYTYTAATGTYVVTTAGGIVNVSQWTGSAWSNPSGSSGSPGGSSGIGTSDIFDGAVTLAKLDTTGTSGYVLTAQGPGNAPVWASGGGGTVSFGIIEQIRLGAFT